MNGGSFDVSDPQFHKDVGFFVFKLPFESFLVHWAFVTLVVVVLSPWSPLPERRDPGAWGTPEGGPPVKAHLSVLLRLIALVKAVGYYLARFNLDLSHNGYVQGAGYTDVHARLPALTLLIWISLLPRVILLINIRRQGLGVPDPRGGAVGVRGRDRRHHLPGHRPDGERRTRPRTPSSSPTSSATSTPPGPPWASTR